MWNTIYIQNNNNNKNIHPVCLVRHLLLAISFLLGKIHVAQNWWFHHRKKKIIYFNILKHMYFCIQTNTYNSNKNVSSQQKSFFFFGGDIFVTNINFSCKYVMCWNHKIAISDAKISWRHPKNNNLPNIY